MFTKRFTLGSMVWILISIIMVAWCGTAAAQTKYDYDRSVDFTKYKTYKWVPVKGASHPDQLTDKDIKQAVDEQLATKGLTKKDDDPVDLFVGYQVSVDQEKEIVGYGGWRFGGGMATTSTIDIGTIVVDFYDPATKSLIWQGSATKSVSDSSDPDKRMKRLEKSMAKLLANYPPPAGK